MEAVEVPSGSWQTSTTNTCWATFTTQKLFKILPITTVDYNHPFLRCVCPDGETSYTLALTRFPLL